MAITGYSGGQVLRGMEAYNRADTPEPPPPPPPPRYRLTLENNEAESTEWQDLFQLMVQMEGIGYKLIKLERLPPEATEEPTDEAEAEAA